MGFSKKVEKLIERSQIGDYFSAEEVWQDVEDCAMASLREHITRLIFRPKELTPEQARTVVFEMVKKYHKHCKM